MVQTLEAIKGGGGSVRVGATGTIGSLMTREMESMMKQMSQSSTSSRRRPPTVPVSVPCGAIPKKSQPRRNSLNEASSSSSSSSNDRNPGYTEKARSNVRKNDHRIPMLGSSNIPTERKPNREKPDKKGSCIVEVVDIKCGNPDKAWTAPITTRLKKLGFSKLSETVA